jgi:hypothetical protein
VEFGFVIIVAVAWMVLNAVREATKKMPGGQRPGGTGGPLSPRSGARRTPFELPESFADASPGLRDLLDAIENAKARAEAGPVERQVPRPTAPRRLPAPEPEVVREEVFEDARPVRRQRQRVDLDESSVEVARRRREAVARREAGRSDAERTDADHAAFDARIRQEPADATRVAVPAPESQPDLRLALIWREILSPPKSLRDD